jgi:hypothetical protein
VEDAASTPPEPEASLPLIQWRNAWLLVPLGLLNTGVYLYLNHRPPRPSRTLPLTALDRAIPFWPSTIWLYLILLGSDFVLPLFVRDWRLLLRLAAAYGLAITAAMLTFTFLPTHYPRPPLPDTDPLSRGAYHLLVELDTPECCFPSGHVLIPAIGCYAVWRDRRRHGVWLAGGFGLLTLSILTTKQHYVWDLLGGLALAALTIGLVEVFPGDRKASGGRQPPDNSVPSGG